VPPWELAVRSSSSVIYSARLLREEQKYLLMNKIHMEMDWKRKQIL
jgi:hypothetical protein